MCTGKPQFADVGYRNPVLYVMPIQRIVRKLPVVPVSGTGTIPYHLSNVFPSAWFVNS